MIVRSLPRLPAAVGVIVLVTAACTSGAGTGLPTASAPHPSAPAVAPATPTPSPSLPLASPAPPTHGESTAGAIPGAYLEAAIADAASRAGVDPADVTLVSTESRDWPSGALGCPVLGVMYVDMITPGYRIVVEAAGTTYDYRAASRGAGHVRLCENPLGPNTEVPG